MRARSAESPALGIIIQYKALQVKPDWYGDFVIAQTYRMEGSLDEALVYIERALADAPDQPLCLSERGIIRLRSGRIEPALADLHSAVELRPDDVGLRVSIALELRRFGQTAAACEMLQDASELDPANASVTQYLGWYP